MRIIFMGTPQFAVPSLDILVQNGFKVVAVVTAMDSYGGRGGKQLIESPVKKYAIEKGIPVLQPEKLKNSQFLAALASYNADLQIVVAFRMLPEVVWNMPPLGTFNLHGSLLPKYRGAAPINHAVIQGEEETGVTFFKLKHEIDTGDILMQKSMPIHIEDNAGTLHDRMMVLAAEVVLESVKRIAIGDVHFEKQNDDLVTKAPKIFHETCRINFYEKSELIYNFIRGLSPYPSAWCVIEDKEVKVLKSSYTISDDQSPIGTIVSDKKKYLKIKTLDGYIKILELKPEGKKVMPIHDYLNGLKSLPEKVNIN